MKIIAIVPSTPSPYLRKGIFRLGLPILGTIARDRGHQVVILDENISEIDFSWLKKELTDADLIMFSSLTPTYLRTLWFNVWIKKYLGPKGISVPTAIGGIHATFETERVLNDGFDFVFRHEGELNFPQFLEVFENRGDFSAVPNLCWRKNGEAICNPASAHFPDLDKDSTFPDFLDKALFPQWGKKCMAVIETSRSCPFKCSFCSVHPMFGGLRQRKDLEAVVEQIQKLKPGFVFFADDFFASHNNTERSKKLMTLMLEKIDDIPWWGAQVRSDVARDKEWLRLAKRSNCKFLCIGFESISDKALKEAHKGQTLESIEGDIANFRRMGLGGAIHGSFIVGFDSDDKQTAGRTVEWAKKMGIPTIQLGIAIPLPGTEFRKKLEEEGRLLPEAHYPAYCDGGHIVFTHPKMTPLELQQGAERAIKNFYSIPTNIRLSAHGLGNWLKSWIMSFKTKDILERSFRTAALRWYGRSVVKKYIKQNKGYMKLLRKRDKPKTQG